MSLKKAEDHPENIILLGNPDILKNKAYTIVLDTKQRDPDLFEGNEDFFPFELRYVAPFDKAFVELKRLQGIAAQTAGRRFQFKGYIVIDLNSWLTHHEEMYFYMTLLFLIDMADYWKYIFLINDEDPKAAKELVAKILTVFYRDKVLCGVKEVGREYAARDFMCRISKEQNIECSLYVKGFIRELYKDYSEGVLSALLCDASRKNGNKLSMNSFDIITERESIVRYMITPREYDRLISILENQREKKRDGKKEI